MRQVVRDRTLGYWLEYSPKHPNVKPNGYIYQHRLVMEKEIGRLLKDNEDVHHINGNGYDNNLKNLRLFKHNLHAKFHNPGEPIKVICKWCKKRFNSTKSLVEKKGKKYCSYKCANYGTRKCKRPTKIELNKLINTMNWCAIGRMFGVSDNAIRKWAKSYNIDWKRRPYVR